MKVHYVDNKTRQKNDVLLQTVHTIGTEWEYICVDWVYFQTVRRNENLVGQTGPR